MWKAVALLAVSLSMSFVSLPASAADTQVIDDFESGILGSRWSVSGGVVPDDVAVYNAISAYYDGGEGPILYYPPEGSWMLVIESGDPTTTVGTGFTAYDGAVLRFSWFFHTLESPNDGWDDSAGVTINGDTTTLITSGTTGGGVGGENTGWREFFLPLPAGPVELDFWATNDAKTFAFDSQFAIDNVRVTYAVPEPSTSAMMLSALGLVGFVAYRRRTGLSRIGD